jgi:hypothetical protein
LQALLAGDPEPARTDHPDLEPRRDAAELHLLLASIAEPGPETTDGQPANRSPRRATPKGHKPSSSTQHRIN